MRLLEPLPQPALRNDALVMSTLTSTAMMPIWPAYSLAVRSSFIAASVPEAGTQHPDTKCPPDQPPTGPRNPVAPTTIHAPDVFRHIYSSVDIAWISLGVCAKATARTWLRIHLPFSR